MASSLPEVQDIELVTADRSAARSAAVRPASAAGGRDVRGRVSRPNRREGALAAAARPVDADADMAVTLATRSARDDGPA
jgi:hypothetical protein